MKPFTKKTKKYDRRPLYLGMAAIVLIFVFILLTTPKGLFKSRSNLVDDSRTIRPDSGSLVTATMNDKKDIIAQFICPCGRCKIIDDLKDCHCKHPGGAEVIKQFIYERIQENRFTPMQIVEMVSKKYGGRKTI